MSTESITNLELATTRRHYFVVRVSKVDDRDVMDELDAVITDRGYAWFGKYGRPMGIPPQESLKDSRLVVIQRCVTHRGVNYRTKLYAVKSFARLRPSDKAFPTYYNEFLDRIRTWVKISQSNDKENILIQDLLVKSSYTPLTESLRTSMSSHFICWRRN